MCKTLESQEQPSEFKEYRPPPRPQTVTIFDWDDTILCTSFLKCRPDSNPELPEATREKLQRIEAAGISLLEQAKKISTSVFIVTNASPGWVEQSCSLYLPKLVQSLQGIKIVSARGEYERDFPGDILAWKTRAFMEIRGKMFLTSEALGNIIVVGDSLAEMHAAEAMKCDLHEISIKTVKFVENPSISELQKQLELVALKFEKIAASPRRGMKIDLRRKRMAGETSRKVQGPRAR